MLRVTPTSTSTATATVLYYASRALRTMQSRGYGTYGTMISTHPRISIIPSHDCGQGIRIYSISLDSSWRWYDGIGSGFVFCYYDGYTYFTRVMSHNCKHSARIWNIYAPLPHHTSTPDIPSTLILRSTCGENGHGERIMRKVHSLTGGTAVLGYALQKSPNGLVAL